MGFIFISDDMPTDKYHDSQIRYLNVCLHVTNLNKYPTANKMI